MPSPMAVRSDSSRFCDRPLDPGVVAGRRHGDPGGARERDEADAEALGHAVDEVGGRALGGADAGRIDVGAAIDVETSMASTTVARSRGTFTGRVGRASANTSAASVSSSAAAATWRRQPGRFGATEASRSTLVNRTA